MYVWFLKVPSPGCCGMCAYSWRVVPRKRFLVFNIAIQHRCAALVSHSPSIFTNLALYTINLTHDGPYTSPPAPTQPTCHQPSQARPVTTVLSPLPIQHQL